MPVNQAAHSTERIMSAMEKLLAMYARNLANTMIRDVFVLLHQQLQLLPGKVAFRRGTDWAEVEPRRWVQRTRIAVTLGMSEGEKLKRRNSLTQTIAQGNEDMAAGSPLINYKAQYEARVDLARTDGLPNPEQYWVDPESPEGQQAMQVKAQRDQQAMELQVRQFEAQQQTILRVAELQEMTKRISDENDKLEAQRDRVAKMYEGMQKLAAQYVKIAIENDVDVPGLAEAMTEGIDMVEGGEVVPFTR